MDSILSWVLSTVTGIIAGLLALVWVRVQQDMKENKDAIADVHKKLEENFYSKEYTDLLLKPLKESLDRNTAVVERLDDAIDKLTLELAKISNGRS